MKTICFWMVWMSAVAFLLRASAQNTNAEPGADSAGVDPVVRAPNSSAIKDVRKLMPNDILTVRVVGEADLSVERRVSNDGTITYPFLESIKVEGRTPAEVEVLIREGLAKDYLVNPQVMVDVKDYVKQFFTVSGQVNREGQYEYPVDRRIDVLEAISMSQGFSKLAKKSNIEVRRGNEKFQFSEKQLKEANDPAKKFYVQPNDKIIVDERVF